MKVAGVNFESFADAVGVSCVIFFSGCRHHCVGCHSPATHDFDYGIVLDEELIQKINAEISKRPFLNALVLSGGDPMYSADEIVDILPKLIIPNDTIWCYSGFTIDEIQAEPQMNELLKKCSYLVDGCFEADKRDISLRFRGSSNQKVWKHMCGDNWVDVSDRIGD